MDLWSEIRFLGSWIGVLLGICKFDLWRTQGHHVRVSYRVSVPKFAFWAWGVAFGECELDTWRRLRAPYLCILNGFVSEIRFGQPRPWSPIWGIGNRFWGPLRPRSECAQQSFGTEAQHIHPSTRTQSALRKMLHGVLGMSFSKSIRK